MTGIFEKIFGKKDVGEEVTRRPPYAIKTWFLPVRLKAYSSEAVDLYVKLKSAQEEPLLTSIVVEVPKALGVDKTGLAKAKEIRLGYIGAGEEKEVAIPIFGNVTTPPGDYSISLTIFCHYRSYAYILNKMTKSCELRVV